MSSLTCSVQDCPFERGGTCLEAFDDPGECPNTSEVLQEPIEDGDEEEEVDPDVVSAQAAVVQSAHAQRRQIFFGTGDSLGISQANDLRAERVSRLILVAGEVGAGKSTLLIELFAKFLKGPYGGWDFGGSSTLKAFDRAHAPARESSGMNTPNTARTADEGMRFLHLRLGQEELTDLLLSELSGERFKGLIDGATAQDQVPVVEVAERCLVLIDGAVMTTASTRVRAFARTRRLIGALTEGGGLRRETPLLVLASKADLWLPSAEEAVRSEAESLVAFGSERGLDSAWAPLAARPLADESSDIGLSKVLDWMLEPCAPASHSPGEPQSPTGRRFWQDRHE